MKHIGALYVGVLNMLTMMKCGNEEIRMRQPMKYTAYEIRKWNLAQWIEGKAKWVPARSVGHSLFGFTWRWKVALDVLLGKADALYWD